VQGTLAPQAHPSGAKNPPIGVTADPNHRAEPLSSRLSNVPGAYIQWIYLGFSTRQSLSIL
jgi:hypothetical protein